MSDSYDVVVIGAGPVGLYAGFFAAQNGLRAAIVDAQPEVGGQLTSLYPQKFIFDVAGYPQVHATELVDELKRQTLQYNVPTFLNFKVAALTSDSRGCAVKAEDGREVHGRFTLVAAGSGMIVPRKLELADAEKYLGRGLEYVVQNIEDYRGRKVLIIGGGDTALDWANYLVDVATHVTLIHRSERFVGFEGSLQRLQQTSCDIFTNTRLISVSGADVVRGVVIANETEHWSKELEINRILGCIGFTPKLGFIKAAGFEVAEGSIRADASMRTNIDNVYAVGDIANHPGRIKLISTGFGNVQIAVHDILRRIHPTD